MSEVWQDVWDPETGIRDFEVDPVGLAVAESARIRAEWGRDQERLAGSETLQTFGEQLAREWAIETGIIENLYYIERGVTMTLIEQGFQAAHLVHGSTDRDPDYVLALLEDQKSALEGLFAFVKHDRDLSVSYIKELHAAMTRSQPTTEAFSPTGDRLEVPLLRGEWKQLPTYPQRDGIQYRYCPPEQTASEMDRLIATHAEHRAKGIAPEVQAGWLHHRFTQIHPFQDGNGRVARALASLVLIRGGMFPMVVPRDEKPVYLKTLEFADRGDLAPLVLLISRRQEVAYQWSQRVGNPWS